jgi:hypothetical protein
MFGNPAGSRSTNEKFLCDMREGQHWIVNDDLRDCKIRLMPMYQQCRDGKVGCLLCHFLVRHE